jgi:hypothetical protein
VRRELHEAHSWLAREIYDTFLAAKHRDLSGPDNYPYGIAANRTVLDTIRTYLVEQELATKIPSIDEVFAEQTLGL